ncbi:MAG: GLPGLI family protein [Bergeyella zoohelcum]|nr:GLPGLI family protein [Bergeyella zoohelcum]
MKNKFALLLSFLTFILVQSQTKRFYYQVEFYKDEKREIKAKDLVVLDINKEHNLFYSNKYLVTDSINEKSPQKIFPYPKFLDEVKWNKNKENFTFYKQTDAVSFFTFDHKVEIKWKLQNDKKTIEGFEVQKATAEYGGRKWVAWFAKDIPLPYGPYVFYGLPGLVLEIYDEINNDYHFKFVGNKNLDNDTDASKIISKYKFGKATNIKKKDWKKLQISHYKKPLPINTSEVEFKMTHDDGKDFTAQDYRNREEELKAYIKKYNNPIELNEKIDYEKL